MGLGFSVICQLSSLSLASNAALSVNRSVRLAFFFFSFFGAGSDLFLFGGGLFFFLLRLLLVHVGEQRALHYFFDGRLLGT